jgi:hypothetical protein
MLKLGRSNSSKPASGWRTAGRWAIRAVLAGVATWGARQAHKAGATRAVTQAVRNRVQRGGGDPLPHEESRTDVAENKKNGVPNPVGGDGGKVTDTPPATAKPGTQA